MYVLAEIKNGDIINLHQQVFASLEYAKSRLEYFHNQGDYSLKIYKVAKLEEIK